LAVLVEESLSEDPEDESDVADELDEESLDSLLDSDLLLGELELVSEDGDDFRA
jgi:hypothetical protein